MSHFENSNGDDEDDRNICLRNEYLWVFVLLVFRAHILLKMLMITTCIVDDWISVVRRVFQHIHDPANLLLSAQCDNWVAHHLNMGLEDAFVYTCLMTSEA